MKKKFLRICVLFIKKFLRICVLLIQCVFMDLSFVLLLFCSPICVCVYLQVQGPLRECLWAGLPYYCAPLLCVPDIISGWCGGITNPNSKPQ